MIKVNMVNIEATFKTTWQIELDLSLLETVDAYKPSIGWSQKKK